MTAQRIRAWLAYLAMAALTLLLPACATDGQLHVLGYTTKPNYSSKIRTVRVPIFKNRTFYKALEFDLTKEVTQAIEAKTPYKVVGPDDEADTELLGIIVDARKNILLRNQQNTVREAQTVMRVELVWKDLRTGEILSSPREGPSAPPINRQLTIPSILEPMPLPGANVAPTLPPAPPENVDLNGPIPVVTIQSFGSFIPELGSSISTAFQVNVKRMAVDIVSMMEEGW